MTRVMTNNRPEILLEIKQLVAPAPGVTMAVRHLLIGFLSHWMSVKLVWQVRHTESRGRQARRARGTEVYKRGGKAIDNEAC